MGVDEMSTHSGRRSGLPLEHRQRVPTSFESGNEFSAGCGTKVNIYHILLRWLHMVRVVVVNKNSDIFGVIMVDF
jgi:hypothetical protein